MPVQLTASEIYGSSTHCRAGANFYWSGSSAVMRCQFAVNSITRNGVGTYSVNFNLGQGSYYSVAGSSRASTGYTGPDWAQYISFYDLSTNALGVHILDNGDLSRGANEDPQNCSFTTTA